MVNPDVVLLIEVRACNAFGAAGCKAYCTYSFNYRPLTQTSILPGPLYTRLHYTTRPHKALWEHMV